MIDIYLYGALKPLTKEVLRLDVQTPAEALRALCLLIDNFEAVLRLGHWRLEADDEVLSESLLPVRFGRHTSLHIYPDAVGGIAPAVIVGIITVVALIAGYVLAPKMEDYTAREAPDKKPSYLFNGAVNTQEQGGVVPLIFGGPIRVGSTVISAGITSERVQSWVWSGSEYNLPGSDGNLFNSDRVEFFGGSGFFRKKPRVPVEGANTLQTNATIRVVDLIGEGELRGLKNGLKSVFIDGVPVQNEDNSMNVQGVSFEYRAGLPDQAPLTGIPEIETETTIHHKVEHDTPVVQRITNPQANSARVTLRFPRLLTVNDKGDTGRASLAFRIDVQGAGQSYTTQVSQTLFDKNTSPAELSWRVPLSGEAPWHIKVTRTSADSDSDKLQNELYFSRLTEITETRQTYPYSALIGITAEAEKFTGQINKREYEIYGLIVDVPTNYDPETRTYTGLWDGTFKRTWSDNGAWCFYHVLKSSRFGLGAQLADEYLSATKWELYKIARFCDELVPDGQGGMEPRMRFTGVIAKAEDAKKLLDHMLAACRSTLYYGGGAIVPVQDAPRDPDVLLANANVVDGEFMYSGQAASERVSAVAMSFNDPDDSYKLGIELVVDDELVQKYGYRQDDRVAMFCASRSQAQRLARHLLFEQTHESDTLEYSTGLEQASVRPGDVIKQSDAAVAGTRVAFRVAASMPALSVFDASALALDEVVYQGRGQLVVKADLSMSSRGTHVPSPVLGHPFFFIKFFHPSRLDRVALINIGADNSTPVRLHDEEHRAFALQIKQAGKVVATAWLPLAGEQDPYIWHPAEYAAITPQQTFQAELMALNLAVGRVLDFDIALVRTDRAALDSATLTIASSLTLTADDLTGVSTTLAWTANLILPDGSLEQRAVTAISGSRLTLASAPSAPLVADALVVLESPQLSPRLWRVLSVAEQEKLTFKFQARAYHAGKYAAVEQGVHIDTTQYAAYSLPVGVLAAPAVVHIEEYLYQDGTVIKPALSLSVEGGQDARIIGTQFQLQGPDDEDYAPLIQASGRTLDQKDVRLGTYRAQARFAGLSQYSAWTESADFTVLGKARKPSAPTHLRITVRPGTGVLMEVDPITDVDLDDYSYYVATHTSSQPSPSLADATRLARIKSTSYLWTHAKPGAHTVFVVAHDTSDQINHGSVPASVEFVLGVPNPPARLNDSQIGGIWQIEIAKPTTQGVVGIEIRAHYLAAAATSPAAVTAANWATAALLASQPMTGQGATIIDCSFSATGRYRLAARFTDWLGNLSPVLDIGIRDLDLALAQTTQHIYRRTASDTTRPRTPTGGRSRHDYVPSNWTNHPAGTTAALSGEWVSSRTGSRQIWNAWSRPALFSRHARDGDDGQDGRGFEWRGTWRAGVGYRYNLTLQDAVSYAGKSWVCQRGHTATSLRLPDSNGGAAYWSLLADRGQPGPKGDSFAWRGAWSPTINYTARNTVSHDRKSWVATRESQGQAPAANSSYWSLLADRGDVGLGFEWRGAWRAGVGYRKSVTLQDAVSYAGKSWVCQRGHTATSFRLPGSNGGNAYWNLLADRGQPGPKGDSFAWRGAWSAAIGYTIRDTVSHNRSSWIATRTARGQAPAANSSYWSLLADRGKDIVLVVASPVTTKWTTFNGIQYIPPVAIGSTGTQDVSITSTRQGSTSTKWRWTMSNLASAAADRISAGAFFGTRTGWASSQLTGIGTIKASVRITEIATGAYVTIRAAVESSTFTLPPYNGGGGGYGGGGKG